MPATETFAILLTFKPAKEAFAPLSVRAGTVFPAGEYAAL